MTSPSPVTPPSKSLASFGAQAACKSICTHSGILTVHDNHKLGLSCRHKLIDVHELCIWCKSQGQYVAIYFTGALFKTTENNCKFNENRHFTQLAMGFYGWPEYETFFLQLEFRWWTCKNNIDWHVSYNTMTQTMTSYLVVRKSHSRCFNDNYYAWHVFAIDFMDGQPGTIIRIHNP